MDKKIYYSLVGIFVTIFLVGMHLLNNQNNDYDLELMSYYSGGQNIAVDYFNQNSDYNMKFTGVAADNYTTKLDASIASGNVPDIVMVNSDDLGRYTSNGQFANYDDVFASDSNYSDYLDEASEYGLNLGKDNGQQKAIKFENSSSIFVYRSDLASECLGINTPKEMSNRTKSYKDYTKLYNDLKSSSIGQCSELSLFATSEYTNYLLNPNNIIGENGVNSKIPEWLEWIKTNIDTKLVYSRFGQYHELIDDSGSTFFFGDITTVNQLRDIYDFEQPGQWAVTQTPIDYQGATSYFLISKDANLDAVREFFDMTYFNEEWLIENINSIGIIENEQVMKKSDFSEIDIQSYFTNDDIQVELTEAGYKTINKNKDITTSYDYGIRNTITGVMNDYIDETISKDEIIPRIKTDLKTFYQ